MLQHYFLNYILIGLGFGFVMQLMHELAVRIKKSEGSEGEDLEDFTLAEHVQLVLIWPVIVLGMVLKLVQK